ncbi:uncharacterized protein LOC128737318 [Sabethes cyaneus]|uniref:uncharacterized protein LOC128737318 n=1 Tax=Sabethes cyaneus TaxID=53552 RepID=UPI00237EAF97|nr:uncharacterized protein LOC128737318 [Sabethes cyaneus]
MDWSFLPLEILEIILGKLEFKDRMACSLVCHSWCSALFCSPKLARDIVFSIGPKYCSDFRSIIQSSERNFRQLVIVLHTADLALNEIVAEAAKRWNVKFVSLVGEPVRLLSCFKSNVQLFDSITELTLEFTMDRAWPVMPVQEVTFVNLKKFHYLQIYVGPNPMSVLFRLVMPKLEVASIVLDSLANEEAMYWEDPLIELLECDKLKSLEVDLNSSMWDNFFAVKRSNMERLVIRRASDECHERNWHQLFGNMPNLKHVEFAFSSDSMLSNLIASCKKIERIMFYGFCLHDGSFANNMEVLKLKQIHLDGWLTGSLFSSEGRLDVFHLEDLTWKYVELAPAQGTFTIVAPELKRLTLRGCDYKRFLLEVGDCLECVDMDYYETQIMTPNFFGSLENVQRLTLHINSNSQKLALKIAPMPRLKYLELVCSTERHGYNCNALFRGICANCPELEELCIRNEHENELRISYSHFVQLVRLTRLRVLTMHFVTLLDVAGEIPLRHLQRQNIWGCTVSGNSSKQCFPLQTQDKEMNIQ